MTGNSTRIPIPMTQVPMRATPSITVFSSGGTSGQLTEFSSGTTRNVSGIFPESTIGGGYADVTSLGSNPVRFAAYYSAEI